MKQLYAALRLLYRKTTVRFILFYLVLVLAPTFMFIDTYSQTLRAQVIAEKRYEKQEKLNRSAEALQSALDRADLIANTLQASTPLITLLENAYISASDELYAYTAYIQPFFDSILSLSYEIDDIFIYRQTESFIKNYGMVHNLRAIDDFAYDTQLIGAQNGAFLAVDGLSEDDDAGANLVRLFRLYDRSYAKQVAILELRLDLDEILTSALPEADEGAYALCWQDGVYPIVSQGGQWRLAAGEAAMEPAQDAFLRVEAQARGLKLAYSTPLGTVALPSRISTIALMVIPMIVFWLYILRYTNGVSRFSRHIHQAGRAMPAPYEGRISGDEFGSVILEYNALSARVRDLVASVQEAEKLKNAAAYYAMSSQVNPHFMFNTLENIRMRIEVEQYKDASDMLFLLGRYLRYNISMREDTCLMDELENTRQYVGIYQYRIRNLIEYRVTKDDDIPNVRCPVCMLQPIVENCLKHAIRDLGDSLQIHLRIRRHEQGLLIDVSDNGCGMTEEALNDLNQQFTAGVPLLQSLGSHVGLTNVNARIKYFWGNGYGLHFLPNEPTGLICRMYIGLVPDTSLMGGKKEA